MHYLGAHASMAGGHKQALIRINAMGGNVLQCFASSPKSWAGPSVDDETAKDFRKTQKELGIHSSYFHASYLINLANSEKLGTISRHVLTKELTLASKMGVRGSIIHLGSYKDGEKNHSVLLESIGKILSRTPSDSFFIIENAGNRKIGLKLEELGEIVKTLKDKRVRICLDTCHLFAAEYDLSTDELYEKFKDEFDSLVGLPNIECWHVNDSKGELGTFRDLHENLGEGKIDTSVFRRIVNDPQFKTASFILEVPGFDGKGPDKENLDILKGFVD